MGKYNLAQNAGHGPSLFRAFPPSPSRIGRISALTIDKTLNPEWNCTAYKFLGAFFWLKLYNSTIGLTRIGPHFG